MDVFRTLRGEYGARSSRLDEEDPASSVMYVGAPIMNGGEIIGVLSVYKPQRSMLLFIIETKQRLIKLGLTAMVLVLLLGWVLSKWVTQPLRKLTNYAAAVSRGERPVAPVMPGYHLRILGETTEAMREALENRKYVESYVQSLTHEMKSPIAGIRGASELLYEDLPEEKRVQFLGNIKTESLRLQHLVDQLLALASLENRTELGAPTKISVGALIRRVVNQHHSNLLDKGVTFSVVVPDGVFVMGEEFLLETALNNLVQNAIDFSPTGGTVAITAAVERESVRIMICDDGTGIPDFAVERIFDRFYSLPRPSSERKSSGLGLCFSREAIELHQGALAIGNREGAGVEAVIQLPHC
jgi:two-component system sensor histidine kinase CreC